MLRSEEDQEHGENSHNEEPLDLSSSQEYYLSDQIKEDEIGRACRTYGAEDKAYRILVEKFEARRPFGSLRHRWEANKRIELKEIDGRVWIQLCDSSQGQVAGCY